VFVWSKSRAERNPPAVFQNPVSARVLRGCACQGRGRTTRPVFALQGASWSTSTLLFQGAGEQLQSTRRRRRRRRREGSARYAVVPPQTTGGQLRADGWLPTNRTRVRSRSLLLLIQKSDFKTTRCLISKTGEKKGGKRPAQIPPSGKGQNPRKRTKSVELCSNSSGARRLPGKSPSACRAPVFPNTLGSIKQYLLSPVGKG